MTLRPVLPVLITIALLGAALGAQAQFTLMATVIDPASGQPPDTLAPADVRVAEDGVAATVTKVESVVRTVKVQVLIDNGGAVGRAISELRGGVRRLLEGLPADVELTLVTTAPQPRFLVRATKNREELASIESCRIPAPDGLRRASPRQRNRRTRKRTRSTSSSRPGRPPVMARSSRPI